MLLYYVTLCNVMLCYVMLCYVMLCYVMLCYVMLCYVMLCYINNSPHLAQKYARIFVRGHYLFREANNFPRAKLEETVSFEEQVMSKDKYPCIFLKPNGGYCVYYPSNIFIRGRILGNLFTKFLNAKLILSAFKILLVYSKCLVLLILTIYSKSSLNVRT